MRGGSWAQTHQHKNCNLELVTLSPGGLSAAPRVLPTPSTIFLPPVSTSRLGNFQELSSQPHVSAKGSEPLFSLPTRLSFNQSETASWSQRPRKPWRKHNCFSPTPPPPHTLSWSWGSQAQQDSHCQGLTLSLSKKNQGSSAYRWPHSLLVVK